MTVKTRTAPIAAVIAAITIAPAAGAHVTVNPPEWEAGGFARFAVRVPNERDDADTTRITLRLPEEVLSASFQPVEGWKRTVEMAELDPPVTVEGEQVTERIDTVTWSGSRIRPGEFQEFGLSIRVPDEPGTELVFPTVQTYSGGEVVRWIGPADADEPAPRVAVVEPAEEEGATAPAETAVPASAQGDDDDGGSDTLAIVALIAGLGGLAAGLAALARARGSRAPAARAG
jgi:uncharacterized protein